MINPLYCGAIYVHWWSCFMYRCSLMHNACLLPSLSLCVCVQRRSKPAWQQNPPSFKLLSEPPSTSPPHDTVQNGPALYMDGHPPPLEPFQPSSMSELPLPPCMGQLLNCTKKLNIWLLVQWNNNTLTPQHSITQCPSPTHYNPMS